MHQTGYAVDLNSKTRDFGAIRQVMNQHGFTWGGTFSRVDPVHFEINPFGPKGTSGFNSRVRTAALAAETYYRACVR